LTSQAGQLSGLADRFSPEDLAGKQVVVVANTPPKGMRPLESPWREATFSSVKLLENAAVLLV
jgi:hypothetical protein